MSNESLITELIKIKEHSSSEYDQQLAQAYIKDIEAGDFKTSDVLMFIHRADINKQV